MKVVTGYRMTPVELPVTSSALVRGMLSNLRRSLLRAALGVTLGVRRSARAARTWCEAQLERELCAGDVRFMCAWAVLAVTACVDSLVLMGASLVWIAVELPGVIRREQKGGQA